MLTLFRGCRTRCGVSAATYVITFGLARNAPPDGRSCGRRRAQASGCVSLAQAVLPTSHSGTTPTIPLMQQRWPEICGVKGRVLCVAWWRAMKTAIPLWLRKLAALVGRGGTMTSGLRAAWVGTVL